MDTMFAGWLTLHRTGELSHVFLTQRLGLIASGFFNGRRRGRRLGGTWFGSLTWPWSTAAARQRRSSI
jgi:hypothetical protein